VAHRDERTQDVGSVADALEAAKDGFARLAWDLVAGDGEQVLNAQAVSVRCLQRQDGSMPVNEDEQGLVCLVAKSY
jgi:prolyl-tRNA synthetase